MANSNMHFPGPPDLTLYANITRHRSSPDFCFVHGLLDNLDHCFNKPFGL